MAKPRQPASPVGSTNPNAVKLAELQVRRGRSQRAFFEYQFEGARGALEEMRRFTDTRNKKLLDLGCGYGGVSVYLAMNGIRVIAVDNQLYEDEFLTSARRFAAEKKTRVTFCLADANHLPFKTSSFDIIRLDSVLEHLKNPAAALAECRRLLRPDGYVFINFPLFYSPYGGHIFDYIKIPWLHVLPPRWVCRCLSMQPDKPGIITTDYVAKLYGSLNRMTLRKYKRLLHQTNLKEIHSEKNLYLPHDAALFLKALKSAPAAKSLQTIRKNFARVHISSLLVFFFLFLLYRLPIRRTPPFNEVIISGVRSVVTTEGGLAE